jgi:hypothetical protein
MTQNRTTKTVAALLALTLLFALGGCKGESSPTAPPPSSGGGSTTPGGGSTTPPSGASLTLGVSSANPVVNSSSVITATVTVGSAPAPDGTAVEFVTNFGKFVETSTADTPSQIAIRTTVAGKTTATLTANESGTAVVTATVNNVTKAVTITFSATPVITPPASTAPVVSSVNPTLLNPAGGQMVTILGANFREPLVVLFDPGSGGSPIPAQKVSSTDTSIVVLSPKITLATDQQKKFGIIVITQQGSTSEQRATLANAVTYQVDVLTPTINSLSPSSGSIDGGTRTTIFGSGFQEPMQVFFGAAEVKTILVTFDEITVISPMARDTGVPTGAVDVKVINPKTGKTTTLTGGFRYVQKMAITSAGPTVGPITGGTRVQIDGSGFNDPVAVVIGGIAATPVSVSGTRIIAVTNQPASIQCNNITGPISVVNINNGDSATGPSFTFVVVKPSIVSVSGPVTLGSPVQIVVSNVIGPGRITISGQNVTITNQVTNPNGTTTFTVNVPPNLKLDTQACATAPGITQQIQTAFDVIFTDLLTGCTDTSSKGLIVNPANGVLGFAPPAGFSQFTATAANPAAMPPTNAAPSAAQTLTFSNTGGGTLTINSVTNTCGANFSILSPPTPSVLSACDPFAVQAAYTPPPASLAGTQNQCTMTISTSGGNRTFTLSGSVQ